MFDQTLDVEITVPFCQLGPVWLLPIFDADAAQHFFEFLLYGLLLEDLQVVKGGWKSPDCLMMYEALELVIIEILRV